MQSVLSRNWTCVAVSISYDDNHYTTGTSWGNNGGAHLLKGISPEVNAIVQLEFELANYDVAIQRINHYATGISTVNYSKSSLALSMHTNRMDWPEFETKLHPLVSWSRLLVV